MGWALTRVVAGAIGVGSVGVGSFQDGAPRSAARRFGIQLGSDPTSTIMMRAAGARDCLTGSALLYSAVCGGDYRPWLFMRAATDAADGIAGSVAWLLAEGTEIAASEDQVVRHPYRMTMVLARRDGDWLLRQVHGSSPH
jgi:hypothetical protein